MTIPAMAPPDKFFLLELLLGGLVTVGGVEVTPVTVTAPKVEVAPLSTAAVWRLAARAVVLLNDVVNVL